MQCKKISPRTIKTSTNNTKAFFRYIDNEFKVIELEKITSLHIKKYIFYMQGLGRTEVYLNSILKYLRMFFIYCIQEEDISTREILNKLKSKILLYIKNKE